MLAGGRPPGKGEIRSWKSLKLAAGASVRGWLCGPIIGVTVHEDDRTKPCLRAYIGATVPCPGCERNLRLGWRGFVPFYRYEDAKPCLVTIHDDSLAVAEKIGHLKLCIFARGTDKYDSVWVREMDKQDKYQSAFEAKRQPQIITGFLPTLFGMKGVITGEQLWRGPLELSAVNVPTEGERIIREAGKREIEQGANRIKGMLTVTPPAVDEPISSVFPGLAKAAAKNGKH